MSAGTETDQLVGVLHVRPTLVILPFEPATSTSISFGAGLPAREKSP